MAPDGTRFIDATHLKAGDILFKHASASLISRRIKAGQAVHYRQALASLRQSAPAKPSSSPADAGRAIAGVPAHDPLKDAPSQEEATDITHVAIALGVDDVAEFDEGGATTRQIVTGTGYGFVRGPMNLPSRLGKTYEVYRCTSEGLWSRAADKAALVWDLTHASPQAPAIQGTTPLTGSYGVKKMLTAALAGPRISRAKGPEVTLGSFEKTLDEWLSAADRKNAGGRASTNIQFFCSNFVLYCYLWAAAEWQEQAGEIGGLNYVLGTRTGVSPVELYVRITAAGQRFFRYAGTLKN